jgi:hypothetical protein
MRLFLYATSLEGPKHKTCRVTLIPVEIVDETVV